MKATGIIRRIDELGRVVIPKEIRRSMNLKEGVELEIFTLDEKLILQKHSQIEGFIDVAKETAVVLRDNLGIDVIIVDVEKVVVAESVYRDKLGEKISTLLQGKLEDRKSQIVGGRMMEITHNDESSYSNLAISPIVVSGDLVGGIVCFSRNRQLTESDLKVIDIMCDYIQKHLEF